MKTWQQCCDLVGYDPKVCTTPEQKYVYFAYKDGKAVKFDTRELAKAHSNLVECAKEEASEKDIKEYWKTRKALETKASDLWMKFLKEEFDDLPVSVFNYCYSEAYEDGRSGGYDYICEKMNKYTEFASEIIHLTQGKK